MIPKIIHYCWFGAKEKPEKVKKYISTWKQKCADYQIIEWNEANFDLKQNPYCLDAYKNKEWAFVSDYVRLSVLYEYGGIYMDTDVEAIKKFDDLLQYRLFLGFQHDNQVATGTIGACAHNEFIKTCLQSYDKREFINKCGDMDLTPNVVMVTNILTSTYGVSLNGKMQEFGNNMILLPHNYLTAKSFETGVVTKDSTTYAIHHFSGSWLTPKQKKYLDFRQRYYSLASKYFPSIFALNISKFITAYKIGGITQILKQIYNKFMK